MSLLDPQLHAFIQIAKQGTVHAAAEALCLTQTAVTQRLKGLEQKLGVSLFTRSRRGMLITSEGEALLRYCHTAQALEGETMAQIKGAGTTKNVRLTIAGPTSVLQGRVLPAVNEMMKKYPQLLFEVLYRNNDEPQQLLKNGKAQLAILPEEKIAKELESKILSPEEFILVGCKKWQQRKLTDILKTEKIIDFEASDNMTFTYLKHYKLLKHVNHERHFADHPEAIAELVSKGRGYTVLEKSFAEPLLKSNKLVCLNKGKQYNNSIGIVWYARPQSINYLEDLISAIN